MTPRIRHALAALLVTLAALGLGACGSGDEPAATTGTAETGASAEGKGRFTAAQVAKLAGLTPGEGGTWTNVTGCRVTEILLTREQVQANLTSPDALVVTNPAGDVGVTFDAKPGCRESVQANLTKVR